MTPPFIIVYYPFQLCILLLSLLIHICNTFFFKAFNSNVSVTFVMMQQVMKNGYSGSVRQIEFLRKNHSFNNKIEAFLEEKIGNKINFTTEI